VYAAYQRQLGEDDAVDFDDLLMRVVFLFEQHPAVLARYQQRWQQILVDEYQDTNRAQYLICRQLAAKHKNLSSSATTTRASTRGAAPTCATSSTSRPTTPMRRS
jgi:superfamily I DNA/RNA helicase